MFCCRILYSFLRVHGSWPSIRVRCVGRPLLSVLFSRLFVAHSTGLVITSLVKLSLCSSISYAIELPILFPFRSTSSRSPRGIESVNEASLREELPFRFGAPAVEISYKSETTHGTPLSWRPAETSLCWITLVTTLFLLVSVELSLLPSAWHSTNRQDSASSSNRLGRALLPRTACSITDLDQMVAAGAGATTLGVSIYSVAKAYYKIRSVGRTTSGSTSTELSSFGTHFESLLAQTGELVGLMTMLS